MPDDDAYTSARLAEARQSHERWLTRLLHDFDPALPTVVLLPGSMGSALEGSEQPAGAPSLRYTARWIDTGLLQGDARALHVEPGAALPDAGRRIVRAAGAMQFMGLGPYDHTERFFREGQPRRANYAVFAYDWRRDLHEAADLLREFLEAFRERVARAHGGVDPLARTTLLAHGVGGIVAKLFLHAALPDAATPDDVRRWMARFISVGTPFFGTAGQLLRYYQGAAPVRSLLGGKRAMAQWLATLPGAAALLPLDLATWESVGGALRLPQYPCRDYATDAPADPRDEHHFDRYPSWLDPYREHLTRSLAVQTAMARPLPAVVAARCYHLRAYRNKTTAVAWRWGRLRDRAAFHPSAEAVPLEPLTGDGDGTVPYWSAALPETPGSQVVRLEQADRHGALMEHPEVLDTLWVYLRADQPSATVDNAHSLAQRMIREARDLQHDIALSPAAAPTSVTDVAWLKAAGADGRLGLKKFAHRVIE